MMVRWHLVLEQLQHHPELVEEDLQGEVEQLAKTDLPDREQRVLAALQERLGNFGLQQLLSGRAPPPGQSPVSGPSPKSETPTEAKQPLRTTMMAGVDKPDMETITSEVNPQQDSLLTGIEVPHLVPKAEPREAEETIRQVEQKPVARGQPGDPRKQSEQLLLCVLSHLPHLSTDWLSQLAERFRQLEASQQAHIVQALSRRIQTLDNAEQARILETLQTLPKGLLKTALIARLIAHLLTTTVAPPPPPAPPEE